MIEDCIFCGNNNFEKIDYPSTQNQKKLIPFEEIYICKECHLGRAYPLQSQNSLDNFYQKALYWEDEKHFTNKFLNIHYDLQAKYRIAKILPFLEENKNIRILDVGAGHGHILKWATKHLSHSLRYDFIEPDPRLDNIIRNKSTSDNINKVDIKSLEYEAYDLIFLNHVLEHVENPFLFLNHLLDSMKKDGICYLEVPCHDYKFKDSVFPHSLFFDSKSLKYLGRKMVLQTKLLESFGSNSSMATNLFYQLLGKFKTKLLTLFVKTNFIVGAEILNVSIHKYNTTGDQTWIRWIFSKTIKIDGEKHGRN